MAQCFIKNLIAQSSIIKLIGGPVNEIKIKLKRSEKTTLINFVKKGNVNAREVTRARVLLLSSTGEHPLYIFKTLGVARKTIQNIKERYLEGGIERALHDLPRPGKPKKFNGKDRAKITAIACTKAPAGYAKWSLTLLTEKVVELGIVKEISRAQVGRILKKTK
jgi:transposase